MAYRTPISLSRTELEDIIAHLVEAEMRFRPLVTLLEQRALTDVDAQALLNARQARERATQARRLLARLSPDCEERD
jgi:hypothetical protein